MPIYVADDGKVYRQSTAILKMLAAEHGYMPETPSQMYEAEWAAACAVDVFEGKKEFYAFI